MSQLPRLMTRDRIVDAVLLPLIGVAQACALGVGAFATRDAFSALHAGGGPTIGVLAALAGAGVVAAGLELLARRRAEALGQGYARGLRHVLYEHIAGMDRRAVAERRLGSLSLRFVGDLSAARLWYGRGLPRILSAVVVFPGAALVLWMLDPRLATSAGIPILLSIVAMLALALGLRVRQERLRGRRAAISIAMMERIAMAPDLDLMARTERELSDLDAGSVDLASEAVARVTRKELVRLVPQVGTAVAAAIILWMSAQAGLAPGVAAAGLSVLAILTIPMRGFAECWDEYCAWAVAREKALSLLARPSQRRVVVPRGVAVGLKLDLLSLGHRALSHEVPAGTVVAITGPQGSGKSHLAAIIAGLDRPTEGQVLYDGVATPLPRIAYLGDRPSVVQGSLRRALTLGIDPRPASKRIVRVARDFGLADLLAREGGILARIGEAGRTLTQGEVLRLELARAALSKPDLIVIDSSRFLSDPGRTELFTRLRRVTAATVVVVTSNAAEIEPDIVIVLSPQPLCEQTTDQVCTDVLNRRLPSFPCVSRTSMA